jgi:hypothetical protein
MRGIGLETETRDADRASNPNRNTDPPVHVRSSVGIVLSTKKLGDTILLRKPGHQGRNVAIASGICTTSGNQEPPCSIDHVMIAAANPVAPKYTHMGIPRGG